MDTAASEENLIDLIQKQQKQTFHLGLTMAGAVSAGAYTGGVMDYLFQTLDRWEKAKELNRGKWQEAIEDGGLTEANLRAKEYDFSIPMHKVVIEAIGGASAGGMTSTMSMMAAVDSNYTPVTTLEQTNTPEGTKNNIFYESWVRLVETDKIKAMDLMLRRNDLIGEGISSILNVDIIDKLASKAFQNIENLKSENLKKRPYISPNVDLLVTLTSLRGIPISVDFSASAPLKANTLSSNLRHNMYAHKLVAHFVMDHHSLPPDQKDEYLDMQSKLLRDCSIATGAFPFGLKARHIKGISNKYIHAALNRSLNYKVPIDECLNDKFEFIAVDGGTMNNEPFAEVYTIVEKKSKTTRENLGAASGISHGLIMIDPFPNYDDTNDYELKDKVTDLPGELYRTLREQAMVKDSSEINQEYSRWLIAPFKWKERDIRYQYPLCCSSLEAFGGFFDEEFRKHDFFLGRNNCRNFLNRYFTIKWNGVSAINEPIHRYWTDNMRETFQTVDRSNNDVYLPIIPDLSILDPEYSGNPYDYTYKPFPVYKLKALMALRPGIESRVRFLLRELLILVRAPKDKRALTAQQIQQDKEKGELDDILEKLFPPKFLGIRVPKINIPSVWKNFKLAVSYLLRSYVAKKASRVAIETIVKDFHKQGLLGNADDKVI